MESIKEISLSDLKAPAEVAGASVALCFAIRRFTGYSLGIECNTLAGAVKAFLLITTTGGAVKWFNSERAR